MIAKTNSPLLCPWQINLLYNNTLLSRWILRVVSIVPGSFPTLSYKKSNCPVKWNLFLTLDVKLSPGQVLMVPWRWWFMVYTYHLTCTFALFFIILIWLILPHALKLFNVLPSPESSSTPSSPWSLPCLFLSTKYPLKFSLGAEIRNHFYFPCVLSENPTVDTYYFYYEKRKLFILAYFSKC